MKMHNFLLGIKTKLLYKHYLNFSFAKYVWGFILHEINTFYNNHEITFIINYREQEIHPLIGTLWFISKN